MHTCLSRGNTEEQQGEGEEESWEARQINCLVRSWPGCLAFWLGLVNARASSNFAHQVRLMTALALAMINDDAAAAAAAKAPAEEEAAVAASLVCNDRCINVCLFICL